MDVSMINQSALRIYYTIDSRLIYNRVIQSFRTLSFKSIFQQSAMNQVQAISFDEVECGKKVAETKKRFKWNFKVNGTSYLMELANSTLSGKRIVTLNSMEIYTEKSVLNINFDFTHQIDGHSFRITRTPDNLNKFEMRIDNRTFDEILQKKAWGDGEKTEKKQYSSKSYDPFSQFGNVVSLSKTDSKNNEFGDFDFDSFAAPTKPVAQSSQVSQKTKPVADPFGFNPTKVSSANYETVNFQTNSNVNASNFETNNFGNFMNNFNKVDQNLLDQEQFATNTYGRNNLYNDLVNRKPGESSEDWTDFSKQAGNEPKKAEVTSKQMFNKVKQAAEQLKMKVTGYSESLI